jgi:uncharacterized protein (DUF1330 family)
MSAYVFVNFDVVDAQRQAALVPRFLEALKVAGDRVVIMGGVVDTLEGDIAPYARAAVLEFPSVEAAQAFYRSDDYAPIRAERAVAQRARMFIVSA